MVSEKPDEITSLCDNCSKNMPATDALSCECGATLCPRCEDGLHECDDYRIEAINHD